MANQKYVKKALFLLLCAGIMADLCLFAGPLHEAAKVGDCSAIRKILSPYSNGMAFDLGAPLVTVDTIDLLNVKDEQGLTPLENAIIYGHADATQLLLDYSVEPPLDTKFLESAIYCKNNSKAIQIYVHQLPIYVHQLPIKERFNSYTIEKIIDRKDEELFDCFWKRKLSNTDCLDLALYAIKNDQLSIAKKIANNIDFKQILKGCLKHPYLNIDNPITCLKAGIATIEKDFLIKEKSLIFHELALYHAQEGQKNFGTAVLKSLLEIFEYKDIQNERGETALHIACRLGNIDAVEALLKANAKTNILNNKGETPLITAMYEKPDQNHINIVNKLREAGTNIPDHDYMAWVHGMLWLAIYAGDINAAKIYLKYNIDFEKIKAIDIAMFSEKAGVDILQALAHAGATIKPEHLDELIKTSKPLDEKNWERKKNYVETILNYLEVAKLAGPQRFIQLQRMLQHKAHSKDIAGFNYVYSYMFHHTDPTGLMIAYEQGKKDSTSVMAEKTPYEYQLYITQNAIGKEKPLVLAHLIMAGWPVLDQELIKAGTLLKNNDTEICQKALKVMILRSLMSLNVINEKAVCEFIQNEPWIVDIACSTKYVNPSGIIKSDLLVADLGFLAIYKNLPTVLEKIYDINPEKLMPRKPFVSYDPPRTRSFLNIAIDNYGMDAKITKTMINIILKHHKLEK